MAKGEKMPKLRVLNDEEIKQAYYFSEGYTDWDLDVALEKVAQAQHQADLKAFVEWGEELCVHGSYQTSRKAKDCPNCWNALKQLVEQEKHDNGD